MCRTKKNPVPCLYRDKLFPSTGIKKRMRVACSVFVARDGHGITFFPDLSILQGDEFFFSEKDLSFLKTIVYQTYLLTLQCFDRIIYARRPKFPCVITSGSPKF